MKVFRGLSSRPVFPNGTVVAIGNFDGLHLGHQRILRFLVDRAEKSGLTSFVLTFSPHPEKVLGGGRTAMIQTIEQRLGGIRRSGVEAVQVARFSRAFAGLSIDEFARRICASLAAREIVVGENFRFGRRRQGDIEDLHRLGQKYGFVVHPLPPVIRQGQPVSSSRIRSLLLAGNIATANQLLGYPYVVGGRVIKGRGLGHDLGFPTANIRAENEIAPPGVYLTLAGIQTQQYPSLTNSGRRPTFGSGPALIETYLFDFHGTLYGKIIELQFLRRLRKERRFPGADALIRQIQRDVASSRRHFERTGLIARCPKISRRQAPGPGD